MKEYVKDQIKIGFEPEKRFDIKNNTCIIHTVNSFGFDFEKIYNSDKLVDAIDEYIKTYGDFNKVLFILNEILVSIE